MRQKSINLLNALCKRCAEEEQYKLGFLVSFGKQVLVDVIEVYTEWNRDEGNFFIKEKIRFPCEKCGKPVIATHNIQKIPLSTVGTISCGKCGSPMQLEVLRGLYKEKPVEELVVEATYICGKCDSPHSLKKKVIKSLSSVKNFEIGPHGIKVKRG